MYLYAKRISIDMHCPQPYVLPAPDGEADPVNLHICLRMKTKRILRGMSQERLAKALGISYQQLQRYESGKSRLPCSMMFRASLALDVPITYFFEGILDEPSLGAEQALDKATLLAIRDIQSLPDGDTRQSLLRLIADMARSVRPGQDH